MNFLTTLYQDVLFLLSGTTEREQAFDEWSTTHHPRKTRKVFILSLCLLCLSGCTWQQRNELKFVFLPWAWTPPTPHVLIDNQAPDWNVQISVSNEVVGLAEDSRGALVPAEQTNKAYAWGKRQGNDLITSADIVGEVKWSSSAAVRQLKHKVHGKIIWSGFITKPYLVKNGLAYWKVRK